MVCRRQSLQHFGVAGVIHARQRQGFFVQRCGHHSGHLAAQSGLCRPTHRSCRHASALGAGLPGLEGQARARLQHGHLKVAHAPHLLQVWHGHTLQLHWQHR